MKERLVLKDFTYFGGKHCQTTALKSIMEYHDLHLSEEMLLGLGGGLGFIYWYMKKMPAPFVGGRTGDREEGFLINAIQRFGGDAHVYRSTSEKKGHEELKSILRSGEPAYSFVDMAYLPYMAMPEDAHFGGHTITIYGIDEEEDVVFVCDRGKKGVTISVDDLKRARNSKFPPFQPHNQLLKIELPERVGPLEEGITRAIKDCCHRMFNPPISNFGLAGMKKWAKLVPKWPKQFSGMKLVGCLLNVYIYIEIGGTGGSSFRPMYSGFLREAADILTNPGLEEAAEAFDESGRIWTEIAHLALPDSWPSLGRIRELTLEKNRLFEEQGAGALKKMLAVNDEMEPVMKQAAEELESRDTGRLLSDMKEKILELHQAEEAAFMKLDEVIN